MCQKFSARIRKGDCQISSWTFSWNCSWSLEFSNETGWIKEKRRKDKRTKGQTDRQTDRSDFYERVATSAKQQQKCTLRFFSFFSWDMNKFRETEWWLFFREWTFNAKQLSKCKLSKLREKNYLDKLSWMFQEVKFGQAKLNKVIY